MVHNAVSYPKHQPESLLARAPDPPLLSSPASPRIGFQSTNPKSMYLRGVQLQVNRLWTPHNLVTLHIS